MIKYMRYRGAPTTGGVDMTVGAVYVAIGFDDRPGPLGRQYMIRNTHDDPAPVRRVAQRDLRDWVPARGDQVEYRGATSLQVVNGEAETGEKFTLLEESDLGPGAWITERAIIEPLGPNWRPVLHLPPQGETSMPPKGTRPHVKGSTARWEEI